MRKKQGKCSINGCNNLSSMIYYTYPICYLHWERYCKGSFNLKKVLKLPTEVKNPIKTQHTEQLTLQ